MNIITENKRNQNLSLISILESIKTARQYVGPGKLTQEDLDVLIKADPTPQKKFVEWMAKTFLNEKTNIDDLRNTIEEYNVFLNKGKSKIKDITAFKTFKDLKAEVDSMNNSGEGISVRDLENDYEVIVDNDDLYIASPHTHEASRKLGLSKFAHRECSGGESDSAWCTTYKSADHFNSYYYSNNVTFYYIKVKSSQMIEELKKSFPNRYKNLQIVALAIMDGGEIDGYDAEDGQIDKKSIETFSKIIGVTFK